MIDRQIMELLQRLPELPELRQQRILKFARELAGSMNRYRQDPVLEICFFWRESSAQHIQA